MAEIVKFAHLGNKFDTREVLSSDAHKLFVRCEEAAANIQKSRPKQEPEHELTHEIIPLAYFLGEFRPSSKVRLPFSRSVNPTIFLEVKNFYWDRINNAIGRLENPLEAENILLESTAEATIIVNQYYQTVNGRKEVRKPTPGGSPVQLGGNVNDSRFGLRRR